MDDTVEDRVMAPSAWARVAPAISSRTVPVAAASSSRRSSLPLATVDRTGHCRTRVGGSAQGGRPCV